MSIAVGTRVRVTHFGVEETALDKVLNTLADAMCDPNLPRDTYDGHVAIVREIRTGERWPYIIEFEEPGISSIRFIPCSLIEIEVVSEDVRTDALRTFAESERVK